MTQARFHGGAAVVTGAASGIGRATALLLAQRGAKVVVADLDESGIAETVHAITEADGIAAGHVLDVTSEAAWETAVGWVDRTWGRLQILVNSAGIAHVKPVADMSLDEWRRVMAVNLDGVFLGTRAAIRAMRPSGGGSIINISSASGIKAAAGASAYCASKAAVILFSKTAALECVQAGDGIRINAVAPGGVKTPIWKKTPGASVIMESDVWKAPADAPIGKRLAGPGEIAKAILFLASEEASYITGSVLSVDAGYTA